MWDRISSTGSVDDRRGLGGAMAFGGSFGIVGLVLYLAMSMLGGGSNSQTLDQILSQMQQSSVTQQTAEQPDEFKGADNYEVFASKVVGSGNDLWRQVVNQSGKNYHEPTLVLFRNATRSGCGTASSQVGPHYCPYDQSIYIDETFFDELRNRFGAKGGDVAEAYVIAHEMGHHAQNELGIMQQVQSQVNANEPGANSLSVKLELQADCFAGLWAYSVSHLGVFEKGEINEAIDAAAAVGDDRIQGSVQGQVNPETWTHGSSQQRTEWFNRGFSSGKVADCNTF